MARSAVQQPLGVHVFAQSRDGTRSEQDLEETYDDWKVWKPNPGIRHSLYWLIGQMSDPGNLSESMITFHGRLHFPERLFRQAVWFSRHGTSVGRQADSPPPAICDPSLVERTAARKLQT